jgi:hypothetical protein
LAAAYNAVTAGIARLSVGPVTPAGDLVELAAPHRAWSITRLLAGCSLIVAAVVALAFTPSPQPRRSIAPMPHRQAVATVATDTEMAAITVGKHASLKAPIVGEFARQTQSACVGFVQGTARSVDEAVTLATALPLSSDLLEPVLFPEDGLLKRLEHGLAPMADETLDMLRNVFAGDDATRS